MTGQLELLKDNIKEKWIPLKFRNLALCYVWKIRVQITESLLWCTSQLSWACAFSSWYSRYPLGGAAPAAKAWQRAAQPFCLHPEFPSVLTVSWGGSCSGLVVVKYCLLIHESGHTFHSHFRALFNKYPTCNVSVQLAKHKIQHHLTPRLSFIFIILSAPFRFLRPKPGLSYIPCLVMVG